MMPPFVPDSPFALAVRFQWIFNCCSTSGCNACIPSIEKMIIPNENNVVSEMVLNILFIISCSMYPVSVLGFFGVFFGFLTMMSIMDYKTHKIKVVHVLFLWGLSTVYAVSFWDGIGSLFPLLYLSVIFGPLILFGMGGGDIAVLTALWPFFVNLGSMWLFIEILLPCWFLAFLVAFMMDGRDDKRMVDLFFKSKSVAMIPIITIAFFVFLVLGAS